MVEVQLHAEQVTANPEVMHPRQSHDFPNGIPSSRTGLLPSSPLRTVHESFPSSQATLRSPSPLRTVRDTFASHGSSIQ